MIEKKVSHFIETQFPEIYREEGPLFVDFVVKYYEWMESQNNVLFHSKRISEYRDVDETLDSFVLNLKETYLKDIQLDTVTQTRQLIKHSLDLYRSKGTERSVDLFFRAVFGQPADVYYPATDIFRLSDGDWIQPKYIEVTPSENNILFVGKSIRGITSGATAYAERLITRKLKGKTVNIIYISVLNGDFVTGEIVTLTSEFVQNPPIVIGSMTTIDIVAGGGGFKIGDILSISSINGASGLARVKGVSDLVGTVDFQLKEYGWGYTLNTEVIVSEKVFTLQNVIAAANSNSGAVSYFIPGETLIQPLANIAILNANATLNLTTGNELFQYFPNGALSGYGKVISYTSNGSTNGTVYVSNHIGNLHLVETYTSNIAGNVTVTSSTGVITGKATVNNTTIVTGQSSMFNAELFAGRLLGVFVYNANNALVTSYKRNIISVTNSSHLVVNLSIGSSSNNVILRTFNNREVVGSGTNFPASFAYGDRIGFTSNSTNFFYATVNSVVNSTFLTLQQPMTKYYANIKCGTVTANYKMYTSSNVISMNVGTYENKDVTSEVVGISANTLLHLSNLSVGLLPGYDIKQYDANGVIRGAGIVYNVGDITSNTATVYVEKYDGIFFANVGFTNTIRNLANVIVSNTTILNKVDNSVGVYKILGTPTTSNVNIVKGLDSETTATLSKLSSGVFASFDIVDIFQHAETVQFFSDPISDYSDLPLDSIIFGFPKQPNANVTTNYLEDIFSNENLTMGGITGFSSINPGKNYDAAPYVRLRDPFISRYNKKDYIFNLTNMTSVFANGEIVSQNNGASGLVKYISSNSMGISRINFENLFNLTLQIKGDLSGATANIVSYSYAANDEPIGLNAVVTANVQSLTGSITSVDVADSGFGYLQNESVQMNLKNDIKTAFGRINLGLSGKSAGFYGDSGGFLDDDKKIFDGEYYQEYSYEIQTALSFDKYAEMLKKILHVAGTKAFYSVVKTSKIDNKANIKTEIALT